MANSRARPQVRIEGAGPAGATLALLLARRAIDVSVYARVPATPRVVVVPEATVRLAAELWDLRLADLVIGPVVARRVVTWSSWEPVAVEDPGVVWDLARVSELLVDRLRTTGVRLVETNAGEAHADDVPPAAWVVAAAGRARERITAGGRTAIAGVIEAIPGFDAEATRIAAVSTGWLFAAQSAGRGIALVLFRPQDARDTDRDALAGAVAEVWPAAPTDMLACAGGGVPAAPSLACDPIGTDTLRVGDAVLGLDPLRGDGVGYALRGALLAQAVIAGVLDGAPLGLFRAHYGARLGRVFASHVENCIRHYVEAHNAGLWGGEIASMREAHARLPDFVDHDRYRLAGLDLVPVRSSAPLGAIPSSSVTGVAYREA